MAWSGFEHQIWKMLKLYELDAHEKFILAISGGVDSMALLHVMVQLKPHAQFKVAYFHHGISNDLVQTNYRNECKELIRDAVLAYPQVNLEFVTEQSDVCLKSEAEFRDARWNFLRKLQDCKQPIITAHHLDDWVETLTLKLIRGVGPEGFTAFKAWDGNIFRPFLEIQKADLQNYITQIKAPFLDDPTNQSNHYLRNWLRNEWFRLLDEKNPSGYQNYSRSLLRLCQDLEDSQVFTLQFLNENSMSGLDRNWFFSLSEKLQMKALTLFLRHHAIYNFTQGQLEEVKKRLDKNQKDLTFMVINVKWVINASQIMLEL
ncbi:MAG: tRNA lysidine(34) synthetase TilS [Pseudobdellovibrio sp.]